MYSFIGFLDSFVTTGSPRASLANFARLVTTGILHHSYPEVNKTRASKEPAIDFPWNPGMLGD